MKNFKVHKGVVGFMILLFIFTIVSMNSFAQPAEQQFDWKQWYDNATVIKQEINFPQIDAKDCIYNPYNQDYVVEVLFNYYPEGTLPNQVDPIELQYWFIYRYLDSCELESQLWYDWYTQFKGIEW
jgi:hypothetical protein